MNQKQIELSKPMAASVRLALETANRLDSQIRALQAQLQVCQTTCEMFLKGIIEQEGFSLEDFRSYGLWNGEGGDAGKVFLRAAPAQVPPAPPEFAKPTPIPMGPPPIPRKRLHQVPLDPTKKQ